MEILKMETCITMDGINTKISKTMTTEEKLVRVKTLMFGLSFDHQRMSSSGQQYFEEICKLLNIKL